MSPCAKQWNPKLLNKDVYILEPESQSKLTSIVYSPTASINCVTLLILA